MQSMTGFGATKVTSAPWVFYIQVRSVNGRFFDLKINIPPYFSLYEGDFRSILQSQFHRGSIELFVKAEIQDLGLAKIPVVNTALIKHYLQALKSAQKELGLGRSKVQVTWSELLRLPEVIRFDAPKELTQSQKKALLKGIQMASSICQKERLREGDALKIHLSNVLQKVELHLNRIQDLAQKDPRDIVNESYRERIKSYLEKKGIEFSEERLLEEWAYFRERSAIFEELERLQSHIENFKRLFDANEPVGKRLDFYTQELLREFNTIGSKTNQPQVTQYVVESKSLIERLKEQVQNIE